MSTLRKVLEDLNRKIVWDSKVNLQDLSKFDAILYSLGAMIDERERVALECVVTLDRIASWSEGVQVDAIFAEPHAAQLARTQLAALGITGPLNQEQEDGQAETRLRGDGQG